MRTSLRIASAFMGFMESATGNTGGKARVSKKPTPTPIKVLKASQEVFVQPPPYIGKPCPFYGFVGIAGVMMENHGNACALAGGHRPCWMEQNGETPDWDACTYFYAGEKNAPDLRELMKSVRIYPLIFKPAGVREWGGILLGRWFKYVMGRPFP